MCGIAGIVGDLEDQQLLQKMLEIMHHRGPDYTGLHRAEGLVLGHNRLSIIDLDERSNQPFHYHDLTLVYNGEIYNYIELREELLLLGYTFRTESDTEVITAAYSAWHHDCVNKFKGMWSFALWDAKKKELFCSRDRFGIKPFYFFLDNKNLVFASEVKALRIHPRFNNDLNQKQVARFLQLGWLYYQNETLFSTVEQLPAAHNMVYNGGQIRTWQYWDLKMEQSSSTESRSDYQENIEMFRRLLNTSISQHMRSDVPIGGCLSGGIDSSAIASLVSHNHKLPFSTFTIYYEGKSTKEVDERNFVKEVIDKYSLLKPHYSSPQQSQIEESFAHFLDMQDFPSAGSSPISQYFVMKLAKKHGMKVLLDGQGADEYLAGYLHSYYRHIADLGFTFRGYQTLQQHLQGHGFTGMSALKRIGKSLTASLLSEQALYRLEYQHSMPFITRHTGVPFNLPKHQTSRLSNFLYNMLFTTQLPNLLHYEDRNSMAFSIEARVPLLDHELVEHVFTLDNSYKIQGSTTKLLLREATKDVLPTKIYNRKDKKGFITPGETLWLSTFLSHLLQVDDRLDPFLNQNRAQGIIDRFKAGDHRHHRLVWRIAMLNRWFQQLGL